MSIRNPESDSFSRAVADLSYSLCSLQDASNWEIMRALKTQRLQVVCAVLGAYLWLATMPALAQYTLMPSFIFVTNNGAITITRYTSNVVTGPDGNVDIPDYTNGYPVTCIASNAFLHCNQTSVTIPDSITNIGEGAFGYCSYLTNISVGYENPTYTNMGGVLFNKSMTRLIQYPAGLSASGYLIPSSIAKIGAYSFEGCFRLANVTIPDGVTGIESFAFEDCISLTNAIIPNSIKSIGYQAFAGCWSLASLTLPGSAINVDALAFGFCLNLTNIYFLGDAPNIGSDVFYDDSFAVAYYLPETTGWNNFAMLAGIPTLPWLPQMQMTDVSFRTQTNKFGFSINWARGQTIVVEAATNLLNLEWQPVQTNILTTGTTYFSDPQWLNYPNRFYRIRSQ